MAGTPSPENTDGTQDDRLGSWKAIASYLKRDVTTVQRWERLEGMPVHRHVHAKRGSVYAFRSELDIWIKDRRPRTESTAAPTIHSKKWMAPIAAILILAGALGWWLTRTQDEALHPLADARITPLTDFEGIEQAAAISPDGRLVAFLSDRAGPVDVWITTVGTGEFRNLTQGAAAQLLNPEVRTVAFTPDGSLVTFWTRDAAGVSVWSVPIAGGTPQPYRPGAVELDWSSDARRLIYHTADEGDPTFIVSGNESPRQILAGAKGVHNHFQTWSPDDRHIYFVRGLPPDQTDLWRMTADGQQLERLTTHNSRVLYPTFLDERRLLYLATTEDGSGPWLFTFDVDARTSRRLSFGVEQYGSLAASEDRKRIVATVEHATPSLWRVNLGNGVREDSQAARIDVPTVGALSPRLARDTLLYVSAKADGHALSKLVDGIATELWSAPGTRIVGGPAIARDGARAAFVTEHRGGTQLMVVSTMGVAEPFAVQLDFRGGPTWSIDGKSLIVSAMREGTPRLARIELSSKAMTWMSEHYAVNPLWSPDGSFLIYQDADAGPDFVLKAMSADGQPYPLPDIKLPRGARRVVFSPEERALIVLQGEMRHNNFWYIDLDSGERRQLTQFGRDFTIRDFDVSPDGSHIVFDRRQENSDLALIEPKSF